MKLEIHGKGIEVTQAIKNRIEKATTKFKKMRFVSDDDICHVEVKHYKEKKGRATFTYKAIRIGKTFVATGESPDLYIAINNGRDKLYSQLRKWKDEHS